MKKFILSFIMMLSLALLWNGGGKEVKAASNSYVCTPSIKVGNVKYSTKYVKDKKYPTNITIMQMLTRESII